MVEPFHKLELSGQLDLPQEDPPESHFQYMKFWSVNNLWEEKIC